MASTVTNNHKYYGGDVSGQEVLDSDIKSLKLKNPRYNNPDEVFEYDPLAGLDVRFKMLNVRLGNKQSDYLRYSPILGTGESAETLDLTDVKLGSCSAYRKLNDTASSDRYVKIATLEVTPDKDYYYAYNLDLMLTVTNTNGSGGQSEGGIFHLGYYVNRAVNLYYDEGSWLTYTYGDNDTNKQILGIKVLRQFEEVTPGYSDGKPCIKVEVYVHLSSHFNAGPSYLSVKALNNVGMKYYKTNYSTPTVQAVPFDFASGLVQATTTAPAGNSTAPYSYTVEDFPSNASAPVVFRSDEYSGGGLYNAMNTALNSGKTVILEYTGSLQIPRQTATYVGKDQYNSLLFASGIKDDKYYIFDIATDDTVGSAVHDVVSEEQIVAIRFYQGNYSHDGEQINFSQMKSLLSSGEKAGYLIVGTSDKDIWYFSGFGQDGVNEWLDFRNMNGATWRQYDDGTRDEIKPVQCTIYQQTPSDDTSFVMSGATFDELVDAFKNDIPIYATVKRGNATDPIQYKPFNFVLTTTNNGEPSHFYFYLLTHQSSPSIRRLQISPDNSVVWQLS